MLLTSDILNLPNYSDDGQVVQFPVISKTLNQVFSQIYDLYELLSFEDTVNEGEVAADIPLHISTSVTNSDEVVYSVLANYENTTYKLGIFPSKVNLAIRNVLKDIGNIKDFRLIKIVRTRTDIFCVASFSYAIPEEVEVSETFIAEAVQSDTQNYQLEDFIDKDETNLNLKISLEDLVKTFTGDPALDIQASQKASPNLSYFLPNKLLKLSDSKKVLEIGVSHELVFESMVYIRPKSLEKEQLNA